jgi:hypothetical protein
MRKREVRCCTESSKGENRKKEAEGAGEPYLWALPFLPIA